MENGLRTVKRHIASSPHFAGHGFRAPDEALSEPAPEKNGRQNFHAIDLQIATHKSPGGR
jgi:hypothetical protein